MKLLSKIIFLFVFPSLVFLVEASSSFKVRTVAFIPRSERFRNIYGKAIGTIELEAAKRLCNHLELWVNSNVLFKHGRSIGFCNPTKIGTVNGSFGFKVPYQVRDCFTVYAGIGPNFTGIWLKNKSMCCKEKISKGAVGIVAKSGLDFFVREHLFFDFFVDYLYQPVNFQTRVDIGGVKIGLGFGGTF